MRFRNLFLALAFVCFFGCRKARDEAPAASRLPGPAGVDAASRTPDLGLHDVLAPTEVVQGASIYPLRVPLVDESNRKHGLDIFRGRVVLVSMFYTSCPHACPTLISHLKQIDESLSEQDRSQVRVLLISFDPENDTPSVMRKLSADRTIDLTRWKLATTSEDHVREIAAVLGIKYRQSDGAFNHSSVITVLDREGKIAHRFDGLEDAHESIATTLRGLVSSP